MTQPTRLKEEALLKQGFSYIAGIDEAGRGAWAGPVVAAAVILPPSHIPLPETLTWLNDSKKMSPRQRAETFVALQHWAVAIGVGVAAHTYIDQQGIIAATRMAMTQALSRLSPQPAHLLIDALTLPAVSIPQTAFPKADSISLSVAAASVVAKVTRDHLMVLLDKHYPGYGFAQHKGYGTKQHQTALATELLTTARAIAADMVAEAKQFPDIYYAGYTQDALKELAEAHLTRALIFGEPIPTPADLAVENAAYINGLAETVGELRRYALDALRRGKVEISEQMLDLMDEIYTGLVTVDFPSAITGGLRRQTDIVRGILERTRGDVTTAIRQEAMKQALATFETRVSGD